VLNRLEYSVRVKKKNVMIDQIVGFGDLIFIFIFGLSYLE
jgi:hypothetical protein